MSPRSSAVLTPNSSVGNLNLVSVAEVLPEQPSTVYDLVEVSGAEMAGRVPVIPRADFHLRVEFENGKDVFVSFHGRVRPGHDDRRTYTEAQLSNFHIDGLPVGPREVDALFEEAVERLEQWLIDEEAAR